MCCFQAFCLRFWWNSKFEILMTQGFATWNLRGIGDEKFFWCRRVPPLDLKKIFVSDSAQISCVKSLGHKDFKFWVSSKSETKKFFFSKGGTLWRFSDFRKKNFLSPILMKFKIWNPYGLGILHMKFEPNRRQKKFFQNFREKSKGGTLLCQKKFCPWFGSNFICDVPRP